MTIAIQRLCADCQADISERRADAIRCFNCSRRHRREYNRRFNKTLREPKPRYCQDCRSDISERGNSARRCIECARIAKSNYEGGGRRLAWGSSLVDWNCVELHWRDGGGGAMCGSERLGDVFALRIGLLTCSECFRALCRKDVSEYYSRQSVMTDWRDGGYGHTGIGMATPYTSKRDYVGMM